MGLIQEFQKADAERRAEVAALLEEYARGDAQRRSEVAALLEEYARGDAQRRSEVWGGAVAVAPRRRAAPEGVHPGGAGPRSRPGGRRLAASERS